MGGIVSAIRESIRALASSINELTKALSDVAKDLTAQAAGVAHKAVDTVRELSKDALAALDQRTKQALKTVQDTAEQVVSSVTRLGSELLFTINSQLSAAIRIMADFVGTFTLIARRAWALFEFWTDQLMPYIEGMLATTWAGMTATVALCILVFVLAIRFYHLRFLPPDAVLDNMLKQFSYLLVLWAASPLFSGPLFSTPLNKFGISIVSAAGYQPWIAVLRRPEDGYLENTSEPVLLLSSPPFHWPLFRPKITESLVIYVEMAETPAAAPADPAALVTTRPPSSSYLIGILRGGIVLNREPLEQSAFEPRFPHHSYVDEKILRKNLAERYSSILRNLRHGDKIGIWRPATSAALERRVVYCRMSGGQANDCEHLVKAVQEVKDSSRERVRQAVQLYDLVAEARTAVHLYWALDYGPAGQRVWIVSIVNNAQRPAAKERIHKAGRQLHDLAQQAQLPSIGAYATIVEGILGLTIAFIDKTDAYQLSAFSRDALQRLEQALDPPPQTIAAAGQHYWGALVIGGSSPSHNFLELRRDLDVLIQMAQGAAAKKNPWLESCEVIARGESTLTELARLLTALV